MKQKSTQRQFFQKIAFCLLAVFFLTSCSKNVDVRDESVIRSTSVQAPEKQGKSYEGVWYLQSLNDVVLRLQGSVITYEGNGYTDTSKFTVKKQSGQIQILPDEEFFVYIDIFYDPDEDVLTAHTLPHMDGDGGYHLLTFARTEYVAPPPPVYGDRIDNSDPNAKKEMDDYKLKHLKFSTYEPRYDYGDMAPQPPVEGNYSYELIVNEDGSAVLASDFCQTITLREEQLKELEDLMEQGSFAAMNGIDIWTEDMPENTSWIDLDAEFENGDTLRVRANGADIPLEWAVYGREFHVRLYACFLEAGYNYWTNEFHSTAPMKRFGRAPDNKNAEYTVEWTPIRLEKKGEAYEYRVWTEYPAVTCTGAPQEFVDTLNALCERFKVRSEAELQVMYEDMAAVPKAVWKKDDNRFAYSFYSRNARYTQDDLLYPLWIDEGHACTFDIGEYGYGYYPDYRVVLDPKTGQILGLLDLFNDEEGLNRKLVDELCDRFLYHDAREVFESADYQKKLKEAWSASELDGGIGFEPQKEGLRLYMPYTLSYSGDYPFELLLYYDEIQDIMADEYCDVW